VADGLIEFGERQRRTEAEAARPLLTRDRDSSLKRPFRGGRVGGIALRQKLAADAIEIGFERATTRASDGRQSFVEYCEGAIDIASIRLGLSERDLDDPVVARKVRSAQQFAAAHLLEPVYGGAALGRRHPLEKHPQP